MMDQNEINLYIEMEIMGRCKSDSSRTAVSGECEVCGQLRWEHAKPIPDYCSDSSPRSLLNEVVAKMDVDKLGGILNHADVPYVRSRAVFVRLPADTIARACVDAHQAK